MSRAAPKPTSWLAFEARYRANHDPWRFAQSAYEQDRYSAIVGRLGSRHYRCAYEPGCSVGVLTERLASIASSVIATDFAPSAVEQAVKRCAGLPQVQLGVADVRDFELPEPPDLIVFSELGYYFEREELGRIALRMANQLSMGGELLAAHWLGHSQDHVLHGDVVHEILLDVLPLRWEDGTRYDGFRIDRWRRT